MKKCTKCKQEKALDEFHKNATNKDGLHGECKVCTRSRVKARSDRNMRTKPREPYINETRPSVYDGAIEVKLVGKNDLWTILDLEDFERLHDFRFYLMGARYAAIKPGVKYVQLHKLIVAHPIVDHINRDPLDNRKANLRASTHSQNSMNKSKQSDNKSGFKGVCWDKNTQKWRADIMVNGIRRFLGRFIEVLDAAKAYNQAAVELHGEFAVLNFGRSDKDEA